MTKRHTRGEPTPLSGIIEQLSEIEGIPSDAVGPLAALIFSSAVETESWEAEIWRHLRLWLDALITTLEARQATSSDAIPAARALLQLDASHGVKPGPRGILVANAVGILSASGCSQNEALAVVTDIYPLVGWSSESVSLQTARKQYYGPQAKKLREIDLAGWKRVRGYYERLADIIQAKGGP